MPYRAASSHACRAAGARQPLTPWTYAFAADFAAASAPSFQDGAAAAFHICTPPCRAMNAYSRSLQELVDVRCCYMRARQDDAHGSAARVPIAAIAGSRSPAFGFGHIFSTETSLPCCAKRRRRSASPEPGFGTHAAAKPMADDGLPCPRTQECLCSLSAYDAFYFRRFLSREFLGGALYAKIFGMMDFLAAVMLLVGGAAENKRALGFTDVAAERDD